jgi:GT2 family glycosyltransferase
MKVLIGIPTGELARQAVFYDYLNGLIRPEGTLNVSFHNNSGARNRNLIIEEAQHNKCTHILFIDDDMAFSPTALMKLLERDVDIVFGLCLNRNYPHYPVIFDRNYNDELVRHYLVDNETGLIEVDACGFGFTLIKTEVFDSLKKPYVRLGEIESDKRSEDIGFCIRAKQAGFKIHCDLDVPIGHIGFATFWPNNIEGVWHTAIDTCGNELINTPQAKYIITQD